MTPLDLAPTTETDAVPVWAVRLEAKLDVALAQHGAKLDEHSRDLTQLDNRVSDLEDAPKATPEAMLDHEQRIRGLEQRPVVSPKALMGILGGLAAAVAAATPYLQQLYT